MKYNYVNLLSFSFFQPLFQPLSLQLLTWSLHSPVLSGWRSLSLFSLIIFVTCMFLYVYSFMFVYEWIYVCLCACAGAHTHTHDSGSVFVVCVYIVLRLTTHHWTAYKRASFWERLMHVIYLVQLIPFQTFSLKALSREYIYSDL